MGPWYWLQHTNMAKHKLNSDMWTHPKAASIKLITKFWNQRILISPCICTVSSRSTLNNNNYNNNNQYYNTSLFSLSACASRRLNQWSLKFILIFLFLFSSRWYRLYVCIITFNFSLSSLNLFRIYIQNIEQIKTLISSKQNP